MMTASSNPNESRLEQRSQSEYFRRDPWTALEGLLKSLTDTTNTIRSIQATVEAAAEALSVDTAFWYSKASNRVSAIAGTKPMDAAWCVQFGQMLVSRTPQTEDVILWKNPPPNAENEPISALLCRTDLSPGCIIVVTFDPNRTFDESDTKVARFTLKMLLSQRMQAMAGTKNLLVGLLHSLTTIIDAKDPFTAGHSERVARIANLIARQMRLSEGQIGDVYLAGLLHDVGKIGLRDEVLQKPSKLTREEYEEVQLHPVISERIVASIKPFDRLRGAVRHHHERWDGTGYPDRLAREAIPLLARVIAVADACDAMMSPRRYRPGQSPIDIDIVFNQETGKQFDPAVVKAFMAIRHEVYPPIYQKGIGESAYHAIDNIVEDLTGTTTSKLPALPTLPSSRPGRL
jgi:HD-GYP domain-containing protein (c-di-GMP phosphodiesterase class II)